MTSPERRPSIFDRIPPWWRGPVIGLIIAVAAFLIALGVAASGPFDWQPMLPFALIGAGVGFYAGLCIGWPYPANALLARPVAVAVVLLLCFALVDTETIGTGRRTVLFRGPGVAVLGLLAMVVCAVGLAVQPLREKPRTWVHVTHAVVASAMGAVGVVAGVVRMWGRYGG